MGSSLDIWLKVLQILAALFVGGAAVWISLLQYRISNTKLRIELYDRRLLIYKETKKYVYNLLHGGDFQISEAIEFWGNVSEGKFLFNLNVSNELDQLYTLGASMASLQKRINRAHKKKLDTAELYKEEDKLRELITDKYNSVDDIFKPYLKLH